MNTAVKLDGSYLVWVLYTFGDRTKYSSWPQTHCVYKGNSGVLILMYPIPECSDYICTLLPRLVYVVLGTKPKTW